MISWISIFIIILVYVWFVRFILTKNKPKDTLTVVNSSITEDKKVTKEMTADEVEFYIHGRMPCCGSKQLSETGITGGMSIIIRCSDCGECFNIEPTVFKTIQRLGKFK
jgi:hypothetical protein